MLYYMAKVKEFCRYIIKASNQLTLSNQECSGRAWFNQVKPLKEDVGHP